MIKHNNAINSDSEKCIYNESALDGEPDISDTAGSSQVLKLLSVSFAAANIGE
jgi:hypothetical protein